MASNKRNKSIKDKFNIQNKQDKTETKTHSFSSKSQKLNNYKIKDRRKFNELKHTKKN